MRTPRRRAEPFRARPSMGGWNVYEALVVVAWFTLLKGLLDGAVNPSLLQVVDQIRQELVANLCRCGTHLRILRAVKRAAGV